MGRSLFGYRNSRPTLHQASTISPEPPISPFNGYPDPTKLHLAGHPASIRARFGTPAVGLFKVAPESISGNDGQDLLSDLLQTRALDPANPVRL